MRITGAPVELRDQLTREVAAVEAFPASHHDWPAALLPRPETADQP